MEHPSTIYPYRLANMTSEYMVRVSHLFMDLTERDHVSDLFLLELPEIDHPAPIVNMVDIKQIGGDSLSTIWEESIGSTSSAQPHTITNPYEEEFPVFPSGFGGAIFAINTDEPSPKGRQTKRELLGWKETPIARLTRWSERMLMRREQTQRVGAPFDVS
jgi:hypothetical protein